MRASPSAVTGFGCDEIGRSGNSSTVSSKFLTNALLMITRLVDETSSCSWSPLLEPTVSSYGRSRTPWEWRAAKLAPRWKRVNWELFRWEKVHFNWVPMPVLASATPPEPTKWASEPGGCDAQGVDRRCPCIDAVAR